MKYRLKGASGALTGQTFALGQRSRIGSAAECEVRIDGLAPEQAVIVERDGGLWLEAAGECLLNGEPVVQESLQSGDELRLGNARLVLQAPGLKPARVLSAEAPSSGGWRIAVWLGLGALASAAAAWWWLAGRGAG